MMMGDSVLNGKVILAVDDDPSVLQFLGKTISGTCPGCRIDTATTYEEAFDKMISLTYDLVVLDIMGVRGFDLLNQAVLRNCPAVMLATHPPNLDALRRSIEMGARAYIPKEKLGQIVPVLEDVLTYETLPGWKRFLRETKDRIENGRVSWDILTPRKKEKKRCYGTRSAKE